MLDYKIKVFVSTLIRLFGRIYINELGLTPEVKFDKSGNNFLFVKIKESEVLLSTEKITYSAEFLDRVDFLLLCEKKYCMNEVFDFEVNGLIYQRFGLVRLRSESWDTGHNRKILEFYIDQLKMKQNLVIIPQYKILKKVDPLNEYAQANFTCPICKAKNKSSTVYLLPEETIFCIGCETDFIKTETLDKKSKLNYYIVKKDYGNK